jgi:hypothetical protein
MLRNSTSRLSWTRNLVKENRDKVSKLLIAELSGIKDLKTIDDAEQERICGGHLPNETELTVILALNQKDPNLGRTYTGDLLADRPATVNIAVVLGSNDKVGQAG